MESSQSSEVLAHETISKRQSVQSFHCCTWFSRTPLSLPVRGYLVCLDVALQEGHSDKPALQLLGQPKSGLRTALCPSVALK